MGELLDDSVRDQIRAIFQKLEEPVELLFFGSQEACEYCEDTRRLAEEVAGLTELVNLQAFDLDQEPDLARKYGVDKVPGLVLAGRENGEIRDYGIRYAGIPSGHEFSSLIHDLVMVSGRDSLLGEETRASLEELGEPVHLQVFVTPTCPYCPQAVLLAHQMAFESLLVSAEMVEAMEFPELSQRFGVSGVPQTTINAGAGTVIGAVPEGMLLAEIHKALAQ
jgi:glutaredoxin-like protein